MVDTPPHPTIIYCAFSLLSPWSLPHNFRSQLSTRIMYNLVTMLIDQPSNSYCSDHWSFYSMHVGTMLPHLCLMFSKYFPLLPLLFPLLFPSCPPFLSLSGQVGCDRLLSSPPVIHHLLFHISCCLSPSLVHWAIRASAYIAMNIAIDHSEWSFSLCFTFWLQIRLVLSQHMDLG